MFLCTPHTKQFVKKSCCPCNFIAVEKLQQHSTKIFKYLLFPTGHTSIHAIFTQMEQLNNTELDKDLLSFKLKKLKDL